MRCLGLLTIVVLGFALGFAHRQVVEEQSFFKSMSSVSILPPDTIPSASQKSIDLALLLFGIEVPMNTTHPTYDPELTDRGLTKINPFAPNKVTIGPSAFTSWGLLGSTLAHEIEIHCKQRMFLVRLIGMITFSDIGVAFAEQQAYYHEINSRSRFHLSREDLLLLRETVRFYYPEKPNSWQRAIMRYVK